MSKHDGAGSQIIPLVNNDGIQAVLGRDLHDFLEVKERYTQWIARHIEKYSFSEGQDFIRDFGKSTGGRPLENHVLSMDMAKELAMLQGNAKGKQARQYFIECEKKARAPKINGAELTRLELIQIAMNAETERLALEAKNKELAPKAEAFESFIDSTGKYSIGAVAKMLGMGQNKLFRELRNRGVLISKGAMRNTPYQQYMHHFEVKAHEYERSSGEMGCSYTTYVQPSGIDFIRRKLDLPTIDPLPEAA
ncbi:phage antirepressor KilAC domain-containing protein [Corynebacterium diphtheriae]|uniref:phage antirepressor KilAC domain-containing protein n=1 Tax=Corynebacterium diphtheriae TaxID=1717 RepID=UPI0013CC406F|nr:phage antirepressor Ant [Corynebacterium diphtheriae]CAB0706923.1 phage antirepressor Ant [Corynebacterium diphtheriae]